MPIGPLCPWSCRGTWCNQAGMLETVPRGACSWGWKRGVPGAQACARLALETRLLGISSSLHLSSHASACRGSARPGHNAGFQCPNPGHVTNDAQPVLPPEPPQTLPSWGLGHGGYIKGSCPALFLVAVASNHWACWRPEQDEAPSSVPSARSPCPLCLLLSPSPLPPALYLSRFAPGAMRSRSRIFISLVSGSSCGAGRRRRSPGSRAGSL